MALKGIRTDQSPSSSRSLTERADELSRKTPRYLSSKELRRLSTLSQARSLFQIVVEWTSILLVIWISMKLSNPFVYLAAVVWIGARMHALAVLMHEGVHYRLFSNRNLNDFVSEVVLAWPLFLTMRMFRVNHFAHHRDPNTVKDPDWMRKQTPDWEFPKNRREFVLMMAKDLLGLSIPQRLLQVRGYLQSKKSLALGFLFARVIFYLSLIVLLTYFKLWFGFLLYWAIPFATWLNMTAHLRSIAEHFAVDDDKSFPSKTRTTLLSPLERLLLSPNNINYHIEHHLYPSVPFYRLPELHQALVKNSEFLRHAHVSKGYLQVIYECIEEG